MTQQDLAARVAELRAAKTIAGGFEAITREQSKQLLEWFMYRVKSDQRQALAATLPAAYNAWCGYEVVQVVSVDDAARVWAADK
jgi:hypothetical protein